jgi:hypothetical protein
MTPDRRTSNQDITKLRELAARGVYLADAAREVGISNSQAAYWNEREHIGLVFRGTSRLGRVHPAPDIMACWRLHQTMQRVTAWQTLASQSSCSIPTS